MKIAYWLRGPVPKSDPFIRAINVLVMAFLFLWCLSNSVRATIPSTTAWVQYTTTSVPQTMTVPFNFQSSTDLIVLDGRASPPITLTLNSDYSVSGGGGGNGAVTTIAGGSHGVTSGDVITITRNVPITQTTTFFNGGPLTASMIGQAFDKATSISQQLNLVGARSLQFQPDETISGVMPLALRKNAFLAFDANGVPYFPPSPSIIGSVANPIVAASMVALRAFSVSGLINGAALTLTGFYALNDGGQGTFVWNSSSTATDDGGTIIQPTGVTTGRWIREFSGYLNAAWFGAKGDNSTDNSTALQNTVNAAGKIGLSVLIPAGRYRFGTTITLCTAVTPGATEIHGAIPDYDFGSYDNLGTSNLGTQLIYTGSTVALATGAARCITVRRLVLTGPGRTTAGSIGVGVNLNSGFCIEECRVQGFETGVKTSYLVDGNSDVNRYERCFISNCYTGIWIAGSQNFDNQIVDCDITARTCIRSDGPHFDVYGGIWSTTYITIGSESVWTTTVASVSGSNVTLTDGSHLVAGQFIVVQANVEGLNAAAPPYNSPIGIVQSVSGNVATIRAQDYVSGIHTGANVVYGWPTINFQLGTSGANVYGTHIENDPDTANPSIIYTSIMVFDEGRQGAVLEGVLFNGSGCNNNLYNKLVPLIYSAGGAFTMRQCSIDFPYPKIECKSSSQAIFQSNRWEGEPIAINNNGYFVPEFTYIHQNDRYARNWGQSLNDPDIGRITKYQVASSWPQVAPQGVNRVEFYDNSNAPSTGAVGEFVQATGVHATNFIGWRETADDGNNSALVTSSITATGNITSGTDTLVVSDVSQFQQFQAITVTGAAGGGGNLTSRVEFIDGSTNTLYLTSNASTTVTNAAIANFGPTFLKAGEVWSQGTATWNPGTITAGTQGTKTITVSSSVVGDFVVVAAPYDLQGVTATGYVSSDGTVTVVAHNGTAGDVTLASGTWKARVLKQ